MIGLEVVERRERAVAGNELCVSRDLADKRRDVVDQPLHASAAVDINERKSPNVSPLKLNNNSSAGVQSSKLDASKSLAQIVT